MISRAACARTFGGLGVALLCSAPAVAATAPAQTPAPVPKRAPTSTQTPAQSPVPTWARARWESLAKTRSLQLSSHMKGNTLSGDFDGDGKADVALLVQQVRTHKIGIVFIHQGTAVSRVVGAGTELGNGGDNFDWMDSWTVQPRTKARATEAVLVERESSASGLIYFANGQYHWKQLGD